MATRTATATKDTKAPRRLIWKREVPKQYPWLTPRYVDYLQREGVLTPLRLGKNPKPNARVFFDCDEIEELPN